MDNDKDDFVAVKLTRDHIIEEGRSSRLLKAGHSYLVPNHHATAIIGAESGRLRTDEDGEDGLDSGEGAVLPLRSSADVGRSLDPAAADAAAYPQQPGNIVGSPAATEANIDRALSNEEEPAVEIGKPVSAAPTNLVPAKTAPLPPKV